jgi:hypothetical protein
VVLCGSKDTTAAFYSPNLVVPPFPACAVDQVLALMRKGAENRHTGETRMNRESSRSHSVFTCVVEKCSRSTQGVTSVICSRLNLIDLAGGCQDHCCCEGLQ